MRLLANRPEGYGSGNKVLHNIVHRLHLLQGDRVTLEAEEVAQEDGTLLLVHQRRELLEFDIASQTCGQLELADGLRIPGVTLAVLAVGELPDVGQQTALFFVGNKACIVEHRVVAGYLFQPYAANGGSRRPEIALQQLRTHAHGFKYLCPSIGTDGADAHLAHNLIKPLAYGFDVVLLSCLIVHLHIASLHQVVQYGESHIGVDGARAVSQQQGGMHHLAYLATLHHESGLHALLHGDEMMVHGTDGKQRRDGSMFGINVAVGEDDVVHPLADRRLGLPAQSGQSFLKALLSLADREQRGKLHRLETLITDVAKDVKLRIVQDRMREAHHLAMALVRQQDVAAHGTDVFRERHHQLLADGVDRRIGHLGKLLTEVVEQQLGLIRQHGQRRIIAHRGRRLHSRRAHRSDDALDVFPRIAESTELPPVVRHSIVHAAAAFQRIQLDAVGRQPLTVGTGRSKLFFQRAVVIDLSLLRVDHQYLARLQAAFLLDGLRVEIDDTGLAGHHHHVILRNQITGRT